MHSLRTSIFILLLISPLTGQAADKSLDQYPLSFIGGSTLFVFLHELGHMLINDFEIPLLGLEENFSIRYRTDSTICP